jgi:putative ABC transport system ATP-binding protein
MAVLRELILVSADFTRRGPPPKTAEAKAEVEDTEPSIGPHGPLRRVAGGEASRRGIVFPGEVARALANKPQLILADEPTGNLDSQTGKMILNLLHELARSEKTTIVVVTHDLSIAGKTDKTFKLQDGKLLGK